MATIINTKLGLNRGKQRLWLEGVKLQREGYMPGQFFDIEKRGDSLVLTLVDNGRYKVSKRNKNGRLLPIIDLSGSYLSEVFGQAQTLRVYINRGVIVVSPHHIEQLIIDRENRINKKLKQGEVLSVGSLFHGGGVLDKSLHHGLKRAGIASAISVAVECDRRYIDASLFNNTELWQEDSIVIESPIELVNLYRNPTPVDILVAGIPCVGASRSGRSVNKLEFAESHSAAGSLFYDFLRFSEMLNPSLIVIENVPEYARTASMEVIRSVLEVRGYSIQERILGGNDFGALENRKCLCVVAISKNLASEFSIMDIQPIRVKENTINDILEPIPLDSERWKTFTYLAEKEIRDKAAGKGFKRQLISEDDSFYGTIGRSYAKCRSTEPFLKHPKDSALSRIFTAHEHARIKSIPSSVISGLSETVAHEILGQSIVFPMFEAVFVYLAKCLKSLIRRECNAIAA